jgi:hypothetical protein
MRRALRFYKAPEINGKGDWSWLLHILKHYECPQDPAELAQMLALIANKHTLGRADNGDLRSLAQRGHFRLQPG